MTFEAPGWLEAVVRLATGLTATGVGLALAGMGLSFVRGAARNWRLARASQGWASAAGMIVSAEVRRVGARRSQAAPHIRYRYQVNGVALEAERLWFANGSAFAPEQAEAVIGRYPPGGAVIVYYDPEQPETATLERRPVAVLTDTALGLLLLASAFLVGVAPGLGILWELWSGQ